MPVPSLPRGMGSIVSELVGVESASSGENVGEKDPLLVHWILKVPDLNSIPILKVADLNSSKLPRA